MTGFTLGMVAGALWLLFFVALGLTAHNSPGHPFRSIRKFRSTKRSIVEVSSTGEAIMDTQHSRGPRAPGSDVDSFLKRYRSIAASHEPRKTTSPQAGAGAVPPSGLSEKAGKKGSLAGRLFPWRKTTSVPEPIKATVSSVRPIKRTKPPAAPAGRFIPPYNYLRPSGYTIPTPSETETLVPTVPWTPPSVEPVSAPPPPPPSSTEDWEDKVTGLDVESVKLLDPKAWPFTEDEAEVVGKDAEVEEPEILDDYESPYLSEGDDLNDSFSGRESARGLRVLMEEHADPTDQLDEPHPGNRGSDHFKAAMDLLARVAKEVEDLESITEGPGDRALGLDDEPLDDEDEYGSSEIAAELMAEFEQASTSHMDSGRHGSAEPETNGGDGEPESARLEASAFETPLGIGLLPENRGSALVAGAEASDDDDLDGAAAFDAQRSVWTYEGISYFLVDEKGRPVLG